MKKKILLTVSVLMFIISTFVLFVFPFLMDRIPDSFQQTVIIVTALLGYITSFLYRLAAKDLKQY